MTLSRSLPLSRSFWVCFPACEMGPPITHSAGLPTRREAALAALASGGTKLLVALSPARASTPPRGATSGRCGPSGTPSPRSPARSPGSPAAPPPRSRPAPALSGAPPAFRRGCGSRKRRARHSALRRPDAPQTTPRTQPGHPAGPNGGGGDVSRGSHPLTPPHRRGGRRS